MKIAKTLLLAAAVTSAVALPIMAGQPAATGKENALARVDAATSKHLEVLNGLLDKVPEQARPAIEKALEVSRKGRDTALAAIAKVTPPEGGKPDATGLERARESVADAFEKSVSTLQGLIGKVPEQAIAHVQDALARVEEHRGVALANLDRLMALGRAERAGVERPERGGRADRPDRAEPPERPERPEVPERPEAPDRPEPPERPERPDRG